LVKIHGSIDRLKSNYIGQLIHEFNPIVSLEIGLAYGIFALTICCALAKAPKTRLIVIGSHPEYSNLQSFKAYNLADSNLIESY
jgi:hypothetical protein